MRGPYDYRTIHNARNPIPYSLFPVPCSLFPIFPLFFPQKDPTPHPPTLWKSFFGLQIAHNLCIINNMIFRSVN